MGMNDQKRLTQVTGITFNPQSSMETPIGGLASSSGNGNVITSQNLNYEDSIAMHSQRPSNIGYDASDEGA